MEKNWLILIILVIATIALIILLLKKNRKDRNDLFKKLPGDYPDPGIIKYEFDNKNWYKLKLQEKHSYFRKKFIKNN